MMKRFQTRWLTQVVPLIVISSLMFGCSGFSLLKRPNSTDDAMVGKSGTGDMASFEGPVPEDRLRPEEVLDATPRWMAYADSALSVGDSTTAEASMMHAIIALQGVMLDVPKRARPSLLDTLSAWTDTYEALFGPFVGDQVATDEGVSEIVTDSDSLNGDSLIEELTVDSFAVALDTTIQEVAQLPDIPDTNNALVKQMVRYFSKNERGRRAMRIWLDRARTMIPRMQPILRRHGLPEDLVYLSMIESGFRTDARSWARAVGPWQFIYSTAHTFDLNANWWYDERRDPDLATHAAARFMRQLYDHLGDWYLAFAAYNCGEGRVRREMRRYHTHDFWKLRRLPRQTKNYVPTFLAARRIAKNPEKYGFDPIEYVKPQPRDTVFVSEPVELTALADALNVDLDVLRKLNPSLLRWCTPPNRDNTPIYLPDGMADGFEDAYANIPAEKKTSWVRHRVHPGETLSLIAEKYHTSMRAIMDVPSNHLKNPNRIREGHYLLIPVPPEGVHGSYAHLYALSDPDLPDGFERRVHIVRRGDTLSEIAERYHVGLSKLLRWNRLRSRSIIRPGQRIVLYKPSHRRRPVQTAQRSEASNTRRAADPNGAAPSLTSPPPTASAGSYRVKRGDSPWTIAQMYNISTRELLAANGMSPRSTIHPGDLLQIPGDGAKASSIVYQVQSGDTLWEIANRFDVSVNDLKLWNNIRDSRSLRPGDRLVVHLTGVAG